MNSQFKLSWTAGVTLMLAACIGCGGASSGPGGLGGSSSSAAGVRIDGSSTVYPITEAVLEEYREVEPGLRITAGFSGTGGGMKKFIAGEIEICDASRGIKDSEKAS